MSSFFSMRRSALSLSAAAVCFLLSGCAAGGGSSAATVSATSLTFGSTYVGSSSAAQTITLSNSGTGPLTGVAVSITGSGGFSETTTCGTTLGAGASCSISIVFTPGTVGTLTGALSVSDGLGTQTATLTGLGACKPALAPTTVAKAPAATGTLAGVPLNVSIQAGGGLPVNGSSVQLYAAGATGLGSAPTALLASPLTTGATGSLLLPGTYTCPSTTSQLYVVARGGLVGASTVPNAGIVMMTALGACNKITSGTSVVVNEVTTVAGAYALSQFMATGGAVGATATNLTGLTNAFATASLLANPVTGSIFSATAPGNVTAPVSRVSSLANLLASCTTKVTANSCNTLFAATAIGGVLPTNTLDAMFNLARAPGTSNVAVLYQQSLTYSTFASPLTAAPADWTMFVTITGGGMNGPSGLGIDSGGNVRVANYFNVASAFSPIGAALYPNGITGAGLDNSYGLAVDASDNAWIPNEQSPSVNGGFGSVSVLNLAGASVAGPTGYSSGGLNYPISVAIDQNTTSWVVDYGNSHVTLLSASGVPLSGTTGYTTPLFAFPVAVVVDGLHFGWVANQSSNDVTKVAPDGSSFTNFNCCNGSSGLAVDQQDNIWVANFYGNSVSQIDSCGDILTGTTPYTAGGNVNHPQGVAIDGSGNVWVANYRAAYVSEVAGATAATPGAALSPSPGYGADAALLEAYAIAVDASGNLWITNFGSNTVTEFIGMAKPVRTPLLSTPQVP